MKRVLHLVLMMMVICFLGFSLSGCGGFLGDGRMDKWADVRKAEEKTKQDVLAVKKVEKEKQPVEVQQNPTFKITTQDSAGKPVIVEADLAPLVSAATGYSPKGKDTDTYGVQLTTTPMPKGEVAENIEATGDAAQKIGNTPAAVGGVVGAAVAGALRETGGGGQRIDSGGGDIQLSDSMKTEKQVLVQSGGDGVTAGIKNPVDNSSEIAPSE